MSYTPAHHQSIVRRTPIKRNVPKVRRGEEGVKVADGFIGFHHGFEGRGDLFVGEEFPVDGFKEWVFLEFGGVSFGSESVFRVSVQKLQRAAKA
jgi:hypothetical protein